MTIIENNSNWEGLANEELCINDKQNNLDVQCMETDYLAILDGTYVGYFVLNLVV
ncbi:unnamed protein product [Trifolium pratense]|uniref:Uncharacterized protein n=1 Tax=Trifolium pratense TaxID=57577 RepID=A0ACB0KC00_TRIPR|nr:unnamed protein product [Trifolium pratense]